MKKQKMRDYNVLLEARGEISLKNRVVKSKKVYNRKKSKSALKRGDFDLY